MPNPAFCLRHADQFALLLQIENLLAGICEVVKIRLNAENGTTHVTAALFRSWRKAVYPSPAGLRKMGAKDLHRAERNNVRDVYGGRLCLGD